MLYRDILFELNLNLSSQLFPQPLNRLEPYEGIFTSFRRVLTIVSNPTVIL